MRVKNAITHFILPYKQIFIRLAMIWAFVERTTVHWFAVIIG